MGNFVDFNDSSKRRQVYVIVCKFSCSAEYDQDCGSIAPYRFVRFSSYLLCNICWPRRRSPGAINLAIPIRIVHLDDPFDLFPNLSNLHIPSIPLSTH